MLIAVVVPVFIFACSNAAQKTASVYSPVNTVTGANVSTLRNIPINIDVFGDSNPNSEIIKVDGAALGSAQLIDVGNKKIIQYSPAFNVSGLDQLQTIFRDGSGIEKVSDVSVTISPWSEPLKLGEGDQLNLLNNGGEKTLAVWQDGQSVLSREFVARQNWSALQPVYTGMVGETIPKLVVRQNVLGDAIAIWQKTGPVSGQAGLGMGFFSNHQWSSIPDPFIPETVPKDITFTMAMNTRDRATVVWQESADMSGNGLHGSFKDRMLRFLTWKASDPGREVMIDPSADISKPLAIMDTFSNIVTVWQQVEQRGIWLNSYYKNSWYTPMQLSDRALNTNVTPVLRGNRAGTGLLTWVAHDENAGVNEIMLQSFVMSRTSVDVPLKSEDIHIHEQDITMLNAAIADSGDWIVVWVEQETGGKSVWAVMESAGIRGTKQKISVDDYGDPRSLQVGMSENGDAAIAWNDQGQLYFRRLAGSKVEPLQFIGDITDANEEIRMVVDKIGNAVALWRDAHGNIMTSDFCLGAELCIQEIPDHSAVSEDCAGCHNGEQAMGKSPAHLETGDICLDCHVTESWRTRQDSHENKAFVSCIDCHNNQVWLGKLDSHLMTSDFCAACHEAGRWIPVVAINHNEVIGICFSCHNSVVAKGKSDIHLPTTESCQVCHKVDSWKVGFNHVDVAGICSTCHDGVTATGKSAVHVSTTSECDNCHALSASWSGQPFDHSGLDICVSCHNGKLATGMAVSHVTTRDECSVCHYSTTSWLGAVLP